MSYAAKKQSMCHLSNGNHRVVEKRQLTLIVSPVGREKKEGQTCAPLVGSFPFNSLAIPVETLPLARHFNLWVVLLFLEFPS